ncbi:hypothetical protein [Mucilaginibacter oryzae]|nr:hypothetical protein [Mucilaginibacter oryzae]
MSVITVSFVSGDNVTDKVSYPVADALICKFWLAGTKTSKRPLASPEVFN